MPERSTAADAGPEAVGGVGDRFAAPARAATRLSLALAGAVLAVELVVPGGWGAASWTVLVAGLLLGLPHGAVDHLVPAWRLGWRPARLASFGLGYAALAAVAYLVFRAAPGPSLAVFVLLSVWHFGSGETAFADLRAGRPVRPRPAASLILGAVVLLVPLLRGLDAPAGDVAALTAAVAPGWGGPPGAGTSVVLVASVGAAAVLAATRARRRRWLEAVDVAVLTALAVVVPPLAAFGVYFGAWHSLRHVARVVAEDPANAAELAAGVLGRPMRRFALVAAGPTGAVGVVLVCLWSWAGGWRGLVATDLPLLAALTVPHVLVVAWSDRATVDQAGSRRMGTCGMPSST
ncbi:Brp/Blh family beta-carotene 15,15'-dioxygenase [Blastococcus deserti]|uniref:Probable beta-carotene 15,15'-dioxygenase n=1 Tax=Blastococcus deserti TaxID=2259033 RepID=A0ABW4XH46_9ACTN